MKPRNQTNNPTAMKTIVKSFAVFGSILLAIADPAQGQTTPSEFGHMRGSNPYYYVGKLSFNMNGAAFQGSGTVIRPYSILTAAHCLYDPASGWAQDVVFERSYHYGEMASSNYGRRLVILGGYSGAATTYGNSSSRAFDKDTGGVVCYSKPAGGGYAGWWGNPALLTGSAYNMSLGYGAEYHDGEQLLRSAPTRSFTRSYGSWYANKSYAIEGGMSGGPVFARYQSNWYVCAVNVSNTAGYTTSGAGVRVVDSATSSLIKTKLK